MDELTLRKVIQQVLSQMGATKETLYVVLAGLPSNLLALLEFLHQIEGYRVKIVTLNHELSPKIRSLFPECEDFMFMDTLDKFPDDQFVTLYPFFSKSLLAKAALGIADDFESKWFAHCLEQGQPIMICQAGLQKNSGKEPNAYQEMFQKYEVSLQFYGVKFIKSFEELKTAAFSVPKGVITYGDVVSACPGSSLTLAKGGVMTDFAKEKAAELGIKIIKL